MENTYHKTMKQPNWKELLEAGMAGTVCLMMLIYGGAKYWQFPDSHQIQKTVAEMSDMELMWAFYGRSKPFALIVGAVEIIGGLLLLPKKTRLIGALLLLPVLVNIVLQDYFYHVLEGAMVAAAFYLLFILIILYFNKEKLFQAFALLIDFPKREETWTQLAIRIGFTLLMVFLLKVVETLFTHYVI